MATFESTVKYAPLLKATDAYRSLRSGGSAFIVNTQDGAAAEVFARLIISHCYDISEETAFKPNADVSLFPETDKPMKVEEIDNMIDRALLSPFVFPCKFFIIRRADTLSEACQNKLLKTLEEPPESLCMILLSQGTGLIDTVVSRCFAVTIPPFSESEVMSALLDYYPESESEARLAAAASRGLIGEADDFINGRESKPFEYAVEIVTKMRTSRNEQRAQSLLATLKEGALLKAIDYIELLYADAAAITAGAEARFVSIKSELAQIALPLGALQGIVGATARARKRIKNHGNLVSVIDSMLFTILEVIALCRK